MTQSRTRRRIVAGIETPRNVQKFNHLSLCVLVMYSLRTTLLGVEIYEQSPPMREAYDRARKIPF